MGHKVRQRFFPLSLSSTVSGTLHPIRLHLQGGCLQSLICSECKWMPDLSLKKRVTELCGCICHMEVGEHLENKQRKVSTVVESAIEDKCVSVFHQYSPVWVDVFLSSPTPEGKNVPCNFWVLVDEPLLTWSCQRQFGASCMQSVTLFFFFNTTLTVTGSWAHSGALH